MHTYLHTHTWFDFSSSPESRSVTSGRASGGRTGQNGKDGESGRWSALGEQEVKTVTGRKEEVQRYKGVRQRKVKGEEVITQLTTKRNYDMKREEKCNLRE